MVYQLEYHEKSAELKRTPCFIITQIKTTYPREFYWKVLEG